MPVAQATEMSRMTRGRGQRCAGMRGDQAAGGGACDWRGVACGEAGLDALANEMSLAPGGAMMTLEVRESNAAAQNLYKKYGFTVVNTRRGYYSDNNENALVMWAGNLKGAVFQSRLDSLKESLA